MLAISLTRCAPAGVEQVTSVIIEEHVNQCAIGYYPTVILFLKAKDTFLLGFIGFLPSEVSIPLNLFQFIIVESGLHEFMKFLQR